MSKIRFIPTSNWTSALAALIQKSASGDKIVLRTEAQREMAECAIRRMCPEKQIDLEVVTDEIWNAPLGIGRPLPK